MSNMQPVSQSAKTAHENAPSISLAPLKTELGDQAHMLQYLPYNKAEFSDQQEDPDAVPLKLHYGTLKTSNDDHVFIFAYPAVNDTISPGFRIFTCDSASNLKGRIPAFDIGSWATPDAAFHGLVHQQKVLAVAKYYFMMRGVDMKYPVPISKTFKEAILAACTVMKKGKDEAAASAVPLTSNHRMVKSEQTGSLKGPTVLPTPYERIMVARHEAPKEKKLGSDGEVEKAGVDTAKARSMVVKLHVGPGSRKNEAGKNCAPEKRPPAVYTLKSSLDDLHGSSHALNGSSDAFSESSDMTIDGSTRAPTHVKTLDPNTQTVAPEKQVLDNLLSLPSIAPDLLHSEHISNTRTRKNSLQTQKLERQANPQRHKSRRIVAVAREHVQQASNPITLNDPIADLRQFKSTKANLSTKLVQHEKDVKAVAEGRKALEGKKAALEQEETALGIREAMLERLERELSDEKKRSQREAKRLRDSVPQEVREWLEFMADGEPERKYQKLG